MKVNLRFAIVILPLLLLLTGCGPIEEVARDSAASAAGVIEKAQARYLDQCLADPSGKPCVIINKGVSAQNLLIDALEMYCAGPEFNAGTAACQPQGALEDKLKAALQGLDQTIVDVKGLLQ